MNHLLLTRDRLDVAAINELASADRCGAISLFVGTTRDHFDNKRVLSLEYEAYEPMAIKQMEAICEEMRARWADMVHIVIYHRLGLVPVREASVVIAASSPHRQSSLDAVAFAIEELKRRVPIWKKELYDNDKSTWKENKESDNRKKILKRPKLEFSACEVVQDAKATPHNLVQIAVEEHEINRRIQCFVEKKREEIDRNNIMDFTMTNTTLNFNHNNGRNSFTPVENSTCARANSIVIKQELSKCHLKVRRIQNRTGPQTKTDYHLQALDKLMLNKEILTTRIKQERSELISQQRTSPQILPVSLQERLTDIEEHLLMPSDVVNTKYIYKRLKHIENCILHLESISPEYAHFLVTERLAPLTAKQEQQFDNKSKAENLSKHKIYSAGELDAIIEQMQHRYDSDQDEDLRGGTLSMQLSN